MAGTFIPYALQSWSTGPCQSASDRAPRSASKGDPLVLRFERLAFTPWELVGVGERGKRGLTCDLRFGS